MTRTTVFHASDLHLGLAGGPERGRAGALAWAEFARAVVESEPDLVILSGDLVVDDPDDDADQSEAHRLIAALPVPVVVVPGNHDVGDHPVRAGLPDDWRGKPVTGDRVEKWERRWGPSFRLASAGAFEVLAVNSQLLGSGLPREAEQWAWLERVALPAIGTRPFLLVTHESIDNRPGASGSDSWMSIPSAASARLASLLRGRALLAACAGHTHRYLEWNDGGLRSITAPSLAGPIPVRPDMTQADGDPSTGWLSYTLDDAGRLTVARHALIAHFA